MVPDYKSPKLMLPGLQKGATVSKDHFAGFK